MIVKEPSSSQTGIYDHQNQGQWELDVLRDYGLQSNMATALRAFLDSFYYFCGYKPRWDEWVKQKEPKAGFNPRFKPRGKCVESSRQKLEEEFGIDETALAYLLGEGSWYNFTIKTSCMSCRFRWSQPQCPTSRAKVPLRGVGRRYSLVWFMLTEYSTYQTAIDLKDLRYMGTEGVKTRRSVVDASQIEQLPFHKDLFKSGRF
jgi:hypothetical protein